MRKFRCRIDREGMLVCLIAILFGICLTGNLYGFYIMPDEYTYWSYAAHAAGYDWSETVALGSYFSYGYSVLLYPFFVICRDSVTAYRAAVRFNFLFLTLAYILLDRLGKKLLPEDKGSIATYTAICIFLPCYFFYAQTTMAETLILLLYIAVCCLMDSYLKKNRGMILILLAIVVMYLYVVHMRTVGVLVSALVLLIPHFYQNRTGKGKLHLILWSGMIVLLFGVGSVVKDRAYQEIFGGLNPELVGGNDYGGQLEKIRTILTWNGLGDFLIGLLGKVLYLGLTSFGLFYVGIAKLIKKAKRSLLSIETFILLTIAAQIGISTVYLLTLGEICDDTYGRYNEFILLFPMLYGISELRENAKEKQYKRLIMAMGAIAAAHLAVTVLVVSHIIRTGADNFQGFFITGIGYLYDEKNFTVRTFYRNAYLFNTVLMVVVVLAVVLSGVGVRRMVLYGIVVLEMLLSVQLYQVYQKPYRIGVFRDVSIANEIRRMHEDGYEIYYLDHKYPPSIGIIQFLQRDIPIHVICDQQYEPKPEEKVFYVMDYEDVRYSEWKSEYRHYDMYGHFAILYK